MGVRENKVETYLKEQIAKLGGISRKWVSPGMDGVPDQIVINPVTAEVMIANLRKLKPGTLVAEFYLVEVKTIDGSYEPGQEREHQRLLDAGACVDTVWGDEGVDVWIREVLLK
jgi:hypothetical protein